jgi:hypothetical protein
MAKPLILREFWRSTAACGINRARVSLYSPSRMAKDPSLAAHVARFITNMPGRRCPRYSVLKR